jgi:hypothetical protein
MRLITTKNTKMESKGVSKYELDHHGPWCQRDGAESARFPDGRAERAKSRSVNMARIVAQRATANWRKTGVFQPRLTQLRSDLCTIAASFRCVAAIFRIMRNHLVIRKIVC